MFTISSNGVITITRGDTAITELFLNIGTELEPVQYILKDKDCAYLGVMEPNQSFENALIRKKFTSKDVDENGNILVTFDSIDTIFLAPGEYIYQVKLRRIEDNKEFIDTVVSRKIFNVID